MTPEDTQARRDLERLHEVQQTLIKSVDKLNSSIEGLHIQMAATYVRQDVYEANQQLHKQVHQELRGDISGLQKAKWAVIGFVLAAVGSAAMSLVLIR